MLRFIFVYVMALCIPVGIVLLVMSMKRVRRVVSGLFILYAVLTFTESPLRALVIFGVLYIINGTVKDIKCRLSKVKNSVSSYEYEPKSKYVDDTQYIKAKIIDSEDYYEEVEIKDSTEIVKY